MFARTMAFCVFLTAAISGGSFAQTNDTSQPVLQIELNTLNDVEAACRLTFLAENKTEAEIEQAVFETVIFDGSGGVVALSLFDFRALPLGKPRVRQFDVQGISCSSVGRVLINGASTCTTNGKKNTMCERALSLSSRISVELLG